MKCTRTLISMILAVVLSLGTTVNAYASIDTSFTLDFDISTIWTLDFNNDSTLWMNDNNVSVKYASCTPKTKIGKVSVELWIDEDKDGVYTQYSNTGGYTYTLEVGGIQQITLPYGNTVKNYRLVFANTTSGVNSGTFAVWTH